VTPTHSVEVVVRCCTVPCRVVRRRPDEKVQRFLCGRCDRCYAVEATFKIAVESGRLILPGDLVR